MGLNNSDQLIDYFSRETADSILALQSCGGPATEQEPLCTFDGLGEEIINGCESISLYEVWKFCCAAIDNMLIIDLDICQN